MCEVKYLMVVKKNSYQDTSNKNKKIELISYINNINETHFIRINLNYELTIQLLVEQIKLNYFTYLNTRVIDMFERPFITFKFIINNIIERRFVLEPS